MKTTLKHLFTGSTMEERFTRIVMAVICAALATALVLAIVHVISGQFHLGEGAL